MSTKLTAMAARVVPAVLPAGCVEKTIFEAGAARTAKAALVAAGRPAALATSEYPLATASTVRSAKVATPATARTAAVPPSEALPPAGVVASER
ncbi:MAG TPA: carbon monoxide dehydrogenase, partial [Planctomycetota bacterium]|nr:carbon monoxide dehydrogenase [Planctomycetota bacterium]